MYTRELNHDCDIVPFDSFKQRLHKGCIHKAHLSQVSLLCDVTQPSDCQLDLTSHLVVPRCGMTDMSGVFAGMKDVKD